MLADPDGAARELHLPSRRDHAVGPRPWRGGRGRAGRAPLWLSRVGMVRLVGGTRTDPAAAAEFVAATGVDLLAVSVGNVHIRTSGEGGLDLGLLEQIHRRVPVPLVLHGGTGIAPESLRAAIGLGVAKVNFGTYLKQRYLEAVRAALGRDCGDPHRLLGMGGTRRCPGGWPVRRARCRSRTDRLAGLPRQSHAHEQPRMARSIASGWSWSLSTIQRKALKWRVEYSSCSMHEALW